MYHSSKKKKIINTFCTILGGKIMVGYIEKFHEPDREQLLGP
jgi:hypothetical protein